MIDNGDGPLCKVAILLIGHPAIMNGLTVAYWFWQMDDNMDTYRQITINSHML